MAEFLLVLARVPNIRISLWGTDVWKALTACGKAHHILNTMQTYGTPILPWSSVSEPIRSRVDTAGHLPAPTTGPQQRSLVHSVRERERESLQHLGPRSVTSFSPATTPLFAVTFCGNLSEPESDKGCWGSYTPAPLLCMGCLASMLSPNCGEWRHRQMHFSYPLRRPSVGVVVLVSWSILFGLVVFRLFLCPVELRVSCFFAWHNTFKCVHQFNFLHSVPQTVQQDIQSGWVCTKSCNVSSRKILH